MPQIHFRPATQSDKKAIIDFQIKMAKETEDLDLTDETLSLGIQRLFDEPHRGVYYVCESEGKVVASMLTIPEWSEWRNGDVLWIHSVYVIPEFRGTGVFRKMYDFFKQKVEADNSLKGLRLYVEKENVKAQKVYEAVGMTKEHYEMYEWLK